MELVFTATTAYDVGLDSVSVTVAALQIDFVTPLTNGQYWLRVTGTPGTNYTIQVATNLASPSTTWVPLFTSNSVTGTFEFLDSQAAKIPFAFIVRVPMTEKVPFNTALEPFERVGNE